LPVIDLDEENNDGVDVDANDDVVIVEDDDATASSTHLIQADITFVVGLVFI